MSGWTIANNTIRDAECGMLIGELPVCEARASHFSPSERRVSRSLTHRARRSPKGGGRRNTITGNHFFQADLPIHFDNRSLSSSAPQWLVIADSLPPRTTP